MLEINTLGGLVIREDGRAVQDFAFRKEEALLVYLACTRRVHSREVLADLLWDERSQAQALSNLRVILHGLRQRIEPYLVITRQTVGLNPDGDFRLDVAELEDAIRRTKNLGAASGKLSQEITAYLEQALSLFRGEFLEGFSVRDSKGFEDWMFSERERIHNAVVEALHQLVTSYMDNGALPAAIAQARRLLEIDPLHEETHRQLMTLLARTGQRSAALAQYETCQRKLADELDVEPEAETTALYQAIRAGTDRLTASTPAYSHNLPNTPTAFIGRTQELAQTVSALATPDCRLVTLIGPGGVGKTRLALQAATQAMPTFPHGVYLVSLITIQTQELLLSTIAETIQFTFYSQHDPRAQLVNYLRDKQMLLLLDDFGHLLDEANLVSAILAQAPAVKILVTSLERLYLQEEWVIHVQGMQVPTGTPEAAIESYDAMQLFAQTASRNQAGFRITEENQAAVVRICQLVEGMPLGVELAAAWTRIMPCTQIAQKVAQDLDFLSTSARNVPERHRSLRAVFESSWRLLSDTERNAYMTLSVFRGGFSLDAAETVAGAPFAVLTALIDKSMVRVAPLGRYSLHELLRQFAQDKLSESAELAQVRNKHLTYFLSLAENVLSRSGSDDQAALPASFELELDNWRAALDWCQADPAHIEDGLRLAAALWRFWQIGGYVAEGLAYLERMLPQSTMAVSAVVRARALAGAAMLAVSRGDLSKAEALSTESLSTLQDVDDVQGTAIALNVLGTVARSHRNYSEASRLYAESLAHSRQAEDAWLVGLSLSNQGLVAFYQRDYERSAVLLEEALTLFQRIQSSFDTAFVLNLLGRVAQHQGQFDHANRLCKMALEMCWEQGNRLGSVIGLSTLAGICAAQGQAERAARLLGAEDTLRDAIGSVLPPGVRTSHAGNLTALRTQMDAVEFATAWSEGRAMTFEQAVAYALNETTDHEAM